MSEATVGKEASTKGKRWFLSGCGDMKITVRPHKRDRDEDGNVFVQKGEYIAFVRHNKPDRFVGGGHMGNMNPTGMDLNRNRVYGIFMADGDTEKGRKQIEFLRNHQNYLHIQTNELFDVDKLKIIELDWDPTTIPSGSWINGGVIERKDLTIKKPGISEPAPSEAQPAAKTASIASMGKSIRKEEAARK